MEHKLECEIVRDLLPSYVDGLTGDVTNKAVEEHLAGCPDCAAALSRMRAPEEKKTAPDAEVDFLKKVRRRSAKRSLLVGVILMLLGMSLLGFRYFYVGSAADPESLACHVTVEGGTVTVNGTLTASALAVSRVTFDESAGMVRFKVYLAPKAFFNSGDFTASYEARETVGQVRSDDLIIWENGTEIGMLAARLFALQNPYAGDMPSNERIAFVLGVSDRFGPYTNELQTDSEPYGWTLCLETAITARDESAARDIMASDSCAMLACIENLGYVTWRYETEDGGREYTVTAEDAAALAGGDIKSFTGSASEFQKLISSLGLK